jgi:hypothetical protein
VRGQQPQEKSRVSNRLRRHSGSFQFCIGIGLIPTPRVQRRVEAVNSYSHPSTLSGRELGTRVLRGEFDCVHVEVRLAGVRSCWQMARLGSPRLGELVQAGQRPHVRQASCT